MVNWEKEGEEEENPEFCGRKAFCGERKLAGFKNAISLHYSHKSLFFTSSFLFTYHRLCHDSLADTNYA
jgi:hypothetical protein